MDRDDHDIGILPRGSDAPQYCREVVRVHRVFVGECGPKTKGPIEEFKVGGRVSAMPVVQAAVGGRQTPHGVGRDADGLMHMQRA